MRKFLICLCTALTVVLFLAGGVSFAGPQGGITFYTVEQDFKDAAGDLTHEDFSCSAAEPGGVCTGLTPLNSATNDGCFNGTLSEGVEFNTIGLYAAVGTGFLGVGLPAVGPKFPTDEARWTWGGLQPLAVGFKVIGDLINPVDVDCTFSWSGGVLGVATVHGSLQGTFIGAISGEPITAVDCVEQVDGSADFYGKMQFEVGNGPAPPVAATGIWGVIALIGLLMVGSLFFMRRRAAAP